MIIKLNLEKKSKIALINNKASILNTPKEFSTRDLIKKKINKDEPTIFKKLLSLNKLLFPKKNFIISKHKIKHTKNIDSTPK